MAQAEDIHHKVSAEQVIEDSKVVKHIINNLNLEGLIQNAYDPIVLIPNMHDNITDVMSREGYVVNQCMNPSDIE